jgi:hypothetical protein
LTPEENNKRYYLHLLGSEIILDGTELGINGVLIVGKAQNARDMNVDIFASIQNLSN